VKLLSRKIPTEKLCSKRTPYTAWQFFSSIGGERAASLAEEGEPRDRAARSSAEGEWRERSASSSAEGKPRASAVSSSVEASRALAR
jgi:hypothetical protein